MKNKLLAILFIVLISIISMVNIPNTVNSLSPVINKYLLQKENSENRNIKSIKEAIADIENTYSQEFVLKYRFIDLHGLARKLMLSRRVNNVVKLDNGSLASTYEALPQEKVEKYGGHIVELDKYLSNKNIDFLYVAVPYRISPYDSKLPVGIEDYSNENQDQLLHTMNEGGVFTYDLRPELEKDYDEWYNAFYKTDHHWKAETGFWAYTEVAKLLNHRYGYKLNKRSLDYNNYNVKIYKDLFLGSQGKRTGYLYAGADDFSVITPKFKTNMSVDIPIHNIHREGSYEKTMFSKNNLKKDYYNINSYASYIGGDYPLCIQKNRTASNNKKIMILKDSYTLVMQPYFSFMFHEVDVIDLRHFKKETLKDYIDKKNPDIVLMFYTSSMSSYDEAYEFGL